MTEREFVKKIIERLEGPLSKFDGNLKVTDGRKLPYASEILTYSGEEPFKPNFKKYETDILIFEQLCEEKWKPRIVIETKINSISTHSAITYSQKALAHKNVHPYLRYGVLIGNRKHNPLPGRLFRHGQHFDFMISWKSLMAENEEWSFFQKLLTLEYKASLNLDEIIYNSRSRNRKKITSLHKQLKLD